MSCAPSADTGAGLVMTAVAIVTFLGIQTYRVGPRWVWSFDACANPDAVCGVVPAGLVVSIGLGAAVAISLLLTVKWASGVHPASQ